MPHMTPEYYQGTMYYCPDVESDYYPADLFSKRDVADECSALGSSAVEEEEGFFVRLSAEGYLDATGWLGPFATKREAQQAAIDEWNVDPTTGEDLPDGLDEDEEPGGGIHFFGLTEEDEERLFPLAGDVVDGLVVRDHVPNIASIGAYSYDHEILPGIREVFMADGWDPRPDQVFYDAPSKRYARELADRIEESGEINPLIVMVGSDGEPHLLEGINRFVALGLLGKKSFPALVAIDTSDED